MVDDGIRICSVCKKHMTYTGYYPHGVDPWGKPRPESIPICKCCDLKKQIESAKEGLKVSIQVNREYIRARRKELRELKDCELKSLTIYSEKAAVARLKRLRKNVTALQDKGA